MTPIERLADRCFDRLWQRCATLIVVAADPAQPARQLESLVRRGTTHQPWLTISKACTSASTSTAKIPKTAVSLRTSLRTCSLRTRSLALGPDLDTGSRSRWRQVEHLKLRQACRRSALAAFEMSSETSAFDCQSPPFQPGTCPGQARTCCKGAVLLCAGPNGGPPSPAALLAPGFGDQIPATCQRRLVDPRQAHSLDRAGPLLWISQLCQHLPSMPSLLLDEKRRYMAAQRYREGPHQHRRNMAKPASTALARVN